MSNKDLAGDFDVSCIRVAQQFADGKRGHADEHRNAMQAPLFHIYEKGGELVPVSRVYKCEDGNVEGSARMVRTMLKSLQGATLVVRNVSLEMVEKHWNPHDDGSFDYPDEAIPKVKRILPLIVADAQNAPSSKMTETVPMYGSRSPERYHLRA